MKQAFTEMKTPDGMPSIYLQCNESFSIYVTLGLENALYYILANENEIIVCLVVFARLCRFGAPSKTLTGGATAPPATTPLKASH